MLNRQKILLLMLRRARRPVVRVELMKWAFLLKHECETQGGSAFYDFVPFKLGPYSFSLHHEIAKLESRRYVLAVEEKAWKVDEECSPSAGAVIPLVERDVMDVLSRFEHFSTEELLDEVYRSYPHYTVNSERIRLAARPKAEPAVYTAGYEGLSIDGFLNMLVENGIECLVDVRSNPTARRYGFHKSTLSRLLHRLDVEYRHFSELGIHSEARRLFPANGGRDELFRQYEETTLATEETAIETVSALVRRRPSVLVCMESNPLNCHRSRLANRVSQATGLPIIHLGTGA